MSTDLLNALALSALTYSLFRFRSAPPSLGLRQKQLVDEDAVAPTLTIAAVDQSFGRRAWWIQLGSTIRMSKTDCASTCAIRCSAACARSRARRVPPATRGRRVLAP